MTKYPVKPNPPYVPDPFIIQKQKDQVADTGKVISQWISVKDRLPKGKIVLVAMPKGTVTLGICYEKTRKFDVFLNGAIVTVEPTHWMPLPEAPKGEE